MDAGRPIRVLCVDDHQLMREGISAVLRREPDIEVVAEAGDGFEALRRFEEFLPDVTLLDLQMPGLDGVQALQQIRQLRPRAAVIVLTTYDGDARAVSALKAGASGYLLKTSLLTELTYTIRRVHGGQRFIPSEMSMRIAEHAAETPLSAREVQVLHHVSSGRANKEIALLLSLSTETVKMHMKNIMEKLHANDRTHAVTIALNRGFLQLQ